MSSKTQNNLLAFSDYSQKFSFDVENGLPGRMYKFGILIWETIAHDAPGSHFEKSGGVLQSGIKSLVGIPVSCRNIGKIVIFKTHQNQKLKCNDQAE